MEIAKLKFLVVDDSSMVREHVARLLKELGATRVDLAENGKQALQKITNAAADGMPYTLITLDWEMPEMNGLELLRVIRSDKSLKRLAVLMITSKATMDDLTQLLPLQPNGYIVKPFTDAHFQDKVLDLLFLIFPEKK